MPQTTHKAITQRPITNEDSDFLIDLYLTTRKKELEALQHCTEQQKNVLSNNNTMHNTTITLTTTHRQTSIYW